MHIQITRLVWFRAGHPYPALNNAGSERVVAQNIWASLSSTLGKTSWKALMFDAPRECWLYAATVFAFC